MERFMCECGQRFYRWPLRPTECPKCAQVWADVRGEHGHVTTHKAFTDGPAHEVFAREVKYAMDAKVQAANDYELSEITVTFRGAKRDEVERFKKAIERAVYAEHVNSDMNNERIGYGIVITEPGA